jgi:hypothetical protein
MTFNSGTAILEILSSTKIIVIKLIGKEIPSLSTKSFIGEILIRVST